MGKYGNGNGMGMGMKSLKWEGIGTKNLFPHTSSQNVQCRIYTGALISHAETRMMTPFNKAHFTVHLGALVSQVATRKWNYSGD